MLMFLEAFLDQDFDPLWIRRRLAFPLTGLIPPTGTQPLLVAE